MIKEDISAFVNYCIEKLHLSESRMTDEYYYSNIPICVIDTVFSIGAHYTSTTNVVNRFCEHFSIQKLDKNRFTHTSKQFSVSDFLHNFNEYGLEKMVSDVFQSRQRTSTRNGILKAEAVNSFCQVLNSFHVEKFPDILPVIGLNSFERAIMQIPGQRSGISLRYFYMLVGDDNFIKPDRMISRFIRSATKRDMNIELSQELFVQATKILRAEYPQISPRLLDNLIWNYQRTQK